MERYRVLIKPSAAGELEEVLPLKDRRKIAAKIPALAGDPRPPGCVKLSSEEKYRLRHRHFRIVFSIDEADQSVLVVKIAQRKEVYR